MTNDLQDIGALSCGQREIYKKGATETETEKEREKLMENNERNFWEERRRTEVKAQQLF